MLSWIRKRAGSPWVKAFMVIVAITFFGGFGLISSRSCPGMESCLGVQMESPGGEVLAKVGDTEIKEIEFLNAYDREHRAMIANLRSQFPDQAIPDDLIDTTRLRKQVMERLVRQELVKKEAERLKITVSDREVQAEIVRAFGGQQFSPRQYRQILRQQGMSEEYFENFLREQIRFRKVVETVRNGVRLVPGELEERYAFDHQKIKLQYILIDPAKAAPEAVPPEEEIEKYYQEHKIEFYLGQTRTIEYVQWASSETINEAEVSSQEIRDYYQESRERYMTSPPQVNARHILVRVDKDAPAEDIAAARARIEKIRQEALQPEADFAELAKQYSEGPTAERGGELGWFTKQEYRSMFPNMQAMVTEFEQAAFALEEGEVSEPVQTSFGFHILKVTGKKPAEYLPLEQVRDEIKQDLEQLKALELAREQALQFKQEVVQKQKTVEQAAAQAGKQVKTSPWFQLSDKEIPGIEDSAVIVDAAFDLDMNELSDPLMGEENIYIIKLVQIKPERQGTLEEVRQRIIARLKPAAELEAAEKKAAVQLDKLRNGETAMQEVADLTGAAVAETEFMDRVEVSLPQVGFSDTLDAQLARMDEQNPWPEKPVVMDSTIVILKLLEMRPADMDALEEERADYKARVLQRKQDEIVEAWLESLEKGAVEYTEEWGKYSTPG